MIISQSASHSPSHPFVVQSRTPARHVHNAHIVNIHIYSPCFVGIVDDAFIASGSFQMNATSTIVTHEAIK